VVAGTLCLGGGRERLAGEESVTAKGPGKPISTIGGEMPRSTVGSPAPDPPARSARQDRLMFGVRYVVPGAIVLAGAIIMALGSEVDLEGGADIISAGLAVYLANWLFRISLYNSREREDEEAARAYLRAHGHWPDQPPLQPAQSAGRRSANIASERVGIICCVFKALPALNAGRTRRDESPR
jgi:hypothetical protein